MDDTTKQHYDNRLHAVFLRPFYTKESQQATHVCMAGGKYALPENKEAKLPRMIGAEIDDGKEEYMCEVITDRLKFFLDLDLKAESVDCESEVGRGALCADIAFVLHTLGLVPNDAMVLFTACHTPEKSGYHIHLPYLEVTRAEAVAIANAVRALASPDWADAVDATPYHGSLRMLYCSKAGNRQHIGRRYSLEKVFVGVADSIVEDSEVLRQLGHDTARAIALCCVRIPGAVVPHCGGEGAQPVATTAWASSKRIDTAIPSEFAYVGECLGLGATIATKHKRGDDAVLVQTRTRMCPRVGREHKQRSVALLLKSSGVQVLCMDDVCNCGSGKPVVVASKDWSVLLEENGRLVAVMSWLEKALQ